MQKPFSQAFVINLPFKPDRLDKFMQSVPDCIGAVTHWPAVHGDTVRPPRFWKSGNGAWGCYRSHVQILEYAIANKLESYVVFEDDAIFASSFESDLQNVMANIPDDWQQLYLGGQLLHEIKNPPKRINDWVFMPYNVNRTHCFAVHQRGYYDLYDHLMSLPFVPKEHIDHHLGRLHQAGKFAVYCPRRWLVGQGEGWSNISGQFNEATYWPNPEDCAIDHPILKDPRCVFLEAPIEVAKELQHRGWHQGYWKNEEGLDKGVCEAVGHFYPNIRLAKWFEWTRREVVRDQKKIPCLYHPMLTWEKVQQFNFARWVHIVANTTDEALDQLAQEKELQCN